MIWFEVGQEYGIAIRQQCAAAKGRYGVSGGAAIRGHYPEHDSDWAATSKSWAAGNETSEFRLHPAELAMGMVAPGSGGLWRYAEALGKAWRTLAHAAPLDVQAAHCKLLVMRITASLGNGCP